MSRQARLNAYEGFGGRRDAGCVEIIDEPTGGGLCGTKGKVIVRAKAIQMIE